MKFTDRVSKLVSSIFMKKFTMKLIICFPNLCSSNYIAGYNFAIVHFGGLGVHKSKQFNKNYIYVYPFRLGNQVTKVVEPFLLSVITGKLMLENDFRSVKFSWVTVDNMRADIVQLDREARNCLVI